MITRYGIDGWGVAEDRTVDLYRSVGLIIVTLDPFLGKLDHVIFTERFSLSFCLFYLRLSWLVDNC